MKKISLAVTFAAVFFCASTQAATIDVLWYGHESPGAAGTYNQAITSLAASAGTYDPDLDGSNDWNLTIWNAGDDTPDFDSFDALVIGSGFTQFFPQFNATRLLAAKTEIEAARGNRTFISGQDADWHNMNNLQNTDNGPRGFLINAVNWAASGEGLGIVALPDGYRNSGTGAITSTPTWLLDPDSFLSAELAGAVQYFNDEGVIIPAATADFPVNEGLTTAGLSNWGQSAHMCIDKTLAGDAGYASINDSSLSDSCAITIVTESEIDGGTTPNAVPVPAAIWLFGSALLGFVGYGRRRKIS